MDRGAWWSTVHGVTNELDMTEQLTQHPVYLGLIEPESYFSLPLRPLDFGLPPVCANSTCITPVQWCCLLLPLGKSFISSQEFLPALLSFLIKLFYSIWHWDACRSKACSISPIAVDVWNTIVPYLSLDLILLKKKMTVTLGFPCGSAGKESTCNAEDLGLIPGLRRSPGKGNGYPLQYSWASLVAQLVKYPPAMQKTWVWSLGWEDPLEKGKATHSNILVWQRNLQSMGLQESNMTEWLTLNRVTITIL